VRPVLVHQCSIVGGPHAPPAQRGYPFHHRPEARTVQKTLALFDIDGTLTTADTMFAFARHAVGTTRFVCSLVLLSPMLVLARFGLIHRGAAKGRMLRWMFRGHSRDHLEAAAITFVHTVLPGLLRAAGIQQVRAHHAQGHEVFFVSASLDLWLAPFAAQQDATLICTPTHWAQDRFVGLGGPNCRGVEKVRRLKEQVDLASYPSIAAYGDSSGDTEMLAIATTAHFKPFRDG